MTPLRNTTDRCVAIPLSAEVINASIESNFQANTFRSSIALKEALKNIVESEVVPHLRDCCSQASFNTRVSALMKLSVSFLCMPRLSTLMGFGLIPTQKEGYEISKRLKSCVAKMLSILLDSQNSIFSEGDSCNTEDDSELFNL